MRGALLVSIAIALACGKNPSGTLPDRDASATDVGATDAADSGTADTGADDRGTLDTGSQDGTIQDGTIEDGAIEDGAIEDGGPEDGGAIDTGDDGGAIDTGPVDTGPIDGGFVPTFAQRTIDTSFLHGQTIVPIDIEPDGDLDLIGSISLDDTVRLYLNGGDGSSFTPVDVAARNSIVAIHAAPADLDADGDLDIAAVGLFDRSIGFASPGEVTWYRNPGSPSGAWTEVPITGLTFWGARAIEAADLTGDGAPDLVVGARDMMDLNGNPQGNGVHWLRNTGGAFAGPTAIDAALLGVEVVLIHDVDGDGVLDIIASGALSDEIAWYENERPPGTIQANPTFTRHTLFSITEPSGLALMQRDGDTELELAATGDNGSGGRIVVLDPPADPRNLWSASPIANDFGAGRTVRLTAIDLNLDGDTDVAISALDANAIRAYVAAGSIWIMRSVQEPFMGPTFVSAGDVDRDGIPDLITSTYANDPNFDRFDWWRTRP